MNNFKLIYNHIDEKKIKVVQNRPVKIKNCDATFTSKSLGAILGKVKSLKKYSLLKLDVHFDFGKVEFADKTTYILLDMLFYDLFMTTNFNISIHLEVEIKIRHNGIMNTAFIRCLNGSNGVLDRKKFLREYEKKIVTLPQYNSYRRYVKRTELDSDPSLPSLIVTDISFILKQSFDDNEWINDVCEAIGEVVDNTMAHTSSDCLIDIDTCPAINEQNESFKILSIVVVNFSEDRIFDKIKSNIINETYATDDNLYKNVYQAHRNHTIFFDESYEEDDFFHVTAFQNGVTTRDNISGNSGSGLTTLIKNIVGKTTENYSYVLSGKNILFFREEYLQIVDNNFIGFNNENDYLTARPSKEVIDKSDVFIPGTIFHLSLVRKKKYDKKN